MKVYTRVDLFSLLNLVVAKSIKTGLYEWINAKGLLSITYFT